MLMKCDPLFSGRGRDAPVEGVIGSLKDNLSEGGCSCVRRRNGNVVEFYGVGEGSITGMVRCAEIMPRVAIESISI